MGHFNPVFCIFGRKLSDKKNIFWQTIIQGKGATAPSCFPLLRRHWLGLAVFWKIIWCLYIHHIFNSIAYCISRFRALAAVTVAMAFMLSVCMTSLRGIVDPRGLGITPNKSTAAKCESMSSCLQIKCCFHLENWATSTLDCQQLYFYFRFGAARIRCRLWAVIYPSMILYCDTADRWMSLFDYFQFSSVYLIPFKQLHDKIQTRIRTWMEKD